ncbi:MAG: hypothetical protein JSW28_05865 [Thermoplasmata archaeon]|nr:MAG: hypothetical protein JSW28_05865 [Thermoplasmata archaeon]
MVVASKDDVEGWLNEIGLKSLEKTETGNWYFLQKYGESAIQINITYDEYESPVPPMVGVGCLFIDQPEKNQCDLYKKLLELQTISLETKFGIAKNGSIVLLTQRSAVDLDPSELRDMIDTVLSIYNQFHKECLSIIE